MVACGFYLSNRNPTDCICFLTKMLLRNKSEEKLHADPELSREARISTRPTGLNHCHRAGDVMESPRFYVYNQTRECFLSLGVTVANTTFARLKGLIGRLRLRLDEGVWVVPSRGIHTLGVLFPFDLIYLDEHCLVLEAIEYFPTFRIAPIRTQAASVLQLPTHTIYSSQTQPGDQLIICSAEKMEQHLRDRTPAEVSIHSISGRIT